MKKKPNIRNTEKDLAKLMDEINSQQFESVDEINDFLKLMRGKSLSDLPDRTDDIGRSRDLVFEAYEQSVAKGKKLVKQALELDPNNVEAFNYLASIEKSVEGAIKIYKKAIKAGETSLGEKFLEEEKGHFWGIIETRPYMRAKAGLANCYNFTKEVDKAIEIYEELLELNPNDNQGVRYLLSTVLLSKDDLTKYESFIKNIEEEDCAVWNYNNALYYFKKYGQTPKSDKVLLKAYKSNNYVIDYMSGVKEMPNQHPEYIGRGDENEAISYVFDALSIWENTSEALNWIYAFKQKRLRMN